MHELSICQSLLDQVTAQARRHEARRVNRIELAIGPLAGVEAALLSHAFTLARAGTLASEATLDITSLPVRVRCKTCGADSEATAQRLLCGQCGDWHTELLSGDELLLVSLELDVEDTHV